MKLLIVTKFRSYSFHKTKKELIYEAQYSFHKTKKELIYKAHVYFEPVNPEKSS